MTDNEQMAGSVGSSGERDIHEPRRQPVLPLLDTSRMAS
jgi:hypothetical protein